MSWDSAQEIYLNLSQPRGPALLASPQDPTDSPPPTWILGDAFTLRLRLYSLNGGGQPQQTTLAVGDQIFLGGRIKRGTGDLLFNAQGFTATTDGTDTYYETTVDLNTTELAAALSGRQTLQVLVDIEIQNAANTRRRTLVLVANILAQAYDPADTDPTPGTPEYPAAMSLVLREMVGAGFRFKDDGAGNLLFQLKTADTGKFRTVFFNAGVLAWGPEEDPQNPIPASPSYPAADELVVRAPAGAGYRFKDDGNGNLIFQLPDVTDGGFRTAFFDGGSLAGGPVDN